MPCSDGQPGDAFLPGLARFLFAAAAAPAAEQVAAFADIDSTISVDVNSSDEQQVDLTVRVAAHLDEEPLDHLQINFDTSRAALAATAQTIADLIGGIELVDIDELL